MNWREWGVHLFYIVFKNDIDVSSLNTLPSPSTYLQWTGICEIQLFGRLEKSYFDLFIFAFLHSLLFGIWESRLEKLKLRNTGDSVGRRPNYSYKHCVLLSTEAGLCR